jgi:two-component system sensor histidine kinase KdpD
MTITPRRWQGFAAAIALCVIATAVCFAARPWLAAENLVLIYLIVVTVVAYRFGPGESALASLLSVALFDFFFVQPHFSFAVSDTQYLLTFAIMLAVALLISGLSQRLRQEIRMAQERERRTSILYAFTRDIASSQSAEEIAAAGVQEIRDLLGCEATIALDVEELPAGETFSLGGRAILSAKVAHLSEEQRETLGALAAAIGSALERVRLAEESRRAQVAAESEQIRNVLLNSVSHDLRTPLTIIGGAAAALAAGTGDQRQLAESIAEQSARLNRHVQNLLDITRLESEPLRPKFEWHSLEELIGSALSATEDLLLGKRVKTYIAPDLPLVRVDGMLLEKALTNLLENAARFTPDGKEIEIRVSSPGKLVRIQVADRGPGLPPGDEQRIFEKFYRPTGSPDRGFGLGLAICNAVALAHGGRAWAENRAGSGARFYLDLALTADAPKVPVE